jgi:hypothetical protein
MYYTTYLLSNETTATNRVKSKIVPYIYSYESKTTITLFKFMQFMNTRNKRSDPCTLNVSLVKSSRKLVFNMPHLNVMFQVMIDACRLRQKNDSRNFSAAEENGSPSF